MKLISKPSKMSIYMHFMSFCAVLRIVLLTAFLKYTHHWIPFLLTLMDGQLNSSSIALWSEWQGKKERKNSVCVCACVCVCVCMRVCVCVHVFVCMHVCVHYHLCTPKVPWLYLTCVFLPRRTHCGNLVIPWYVWAFTHSGPIPPAKLSHL
jgi:hypothetical protein